MMFAQSHNCVDHICNELNVVRGKLTCRHSFYFVAIRKVTSSQRKMQPNL